MIQIGIDPGLDGAVTILSEGTIKIYDTPTITVQGAKKKKRHYDMPAMYAILFPLCVSSADKCQAIIEQVNAMPGQGVTSMFSMGFGLGAWHMLLTALAIPFAQVRPQAWKAEFGLKGKDKNGSILRAKQLFPAADITLKKHDGRAESLLMAEYARRRLSPVNGTA